MRLQALAYTWLEFNPAKAVAIETDSGLRVAMSWGRCSTGSRCVPPGLADAGVDRAYLSELERAQNSASLDILDRLAAALEVPVATLLREPEHDAEPPANLPRGRKPK